MFGEFEVWRKWLRVGQQGQCPIASPFMIQLLVLSYRPKYKMIIGLEIILLGACEILRAFVSSPEYKDTNWILMQVKCVK